MLASRQCQGARPSVHQPGLPRPTRGVAKPLGRPRRQDVSHRMRVAAPVRASALSRDGGRALRSVSWKAEIAHSEQVIGLGQSLRIALENVLWSLTT